MKIAFTICSNNYVAQAKTLAGSLLAHNPEYKFFIGLVDEPNDSLNYSASKGVNLLPVKDLGIDKLDELILKYNIIEFNTAVKPFYFQYLFDTYKPEHVLYIDPDIVIYQPFTEIDEKLKANSFLLTPHFLTISADEEPPHERLVLRVGLFNLGFLGVKNDVNGNEMMRWFANRMRQYCYYDFHNGYFVDQIWANYIPLYFDNYHILRSPGYNMGYWNLNERVLGKDEKGDYVVNDSYKLIFFHFSGYNPEKPTVLASHTAYSLASRADLQNIFADYKQALFENDYQISARIKPALNFRPIKRSVRERIGLKIQSISNRILNSLFHINSPASKIK